MEPSAGMEIFYGNLHIGLGHGRVHTNHMRQQRLERVMTATHIQQPFMWQHFCRYGVIGAIIICVYTGLPVVSEIII